MRLSVCLCVCKTVRTSREFAGIDARARLRARLKVFQKKEKTEKQVGATRYKGVNNVIIIIVFFL